ncbi:MAG: hypothetical protein ACREMD_03205, partial [Gemmatimonadota bacterium]
ARGETSRGPLAGSTSVAVSIAAVLSPADGSFSPPPQASPRSGRRVTRSVGGRGSEVSRERVGGASA